MNYFVIGKKLPHTLSPEIHKLFGRDYGVFELPSEAQFENFINAKNFKGINITIPYKTQILPYLDYIDPVANKIGAVNTVVNKGGKLFGYNTDAEGMRQNLKIAGIVLKNRDVLILGSGGTAKTACYVAEIEKAKSVTIVSRTGKINYENVYDLTNTQVIINTTPVGMYPNCYQSPINLNKFKNLESVFDVVYNPFQTLLIKNAKDIGLKAENGFYMLIEQARLAENLFLQAENECSLEEKFSDVIANKNFKKSSCSLLDNNKFTMLENRVYNSENKFIETKTEICGTETDEIKKESFLKIPYEKTKAVYERLLNEKLNLTLTGMAGVGKSTIGKKLAEVLNRPFVDTDEEIEKIEGMSITEIFAQKGEEYFRNIESNIIERVLCRQGQVVALGGGAILKPENRFYICANSFVCLINRKTEKIDMKNRPLSTDRETVERILEYRKNFYIEVADIAVYNDTTLDNTVKEILFNYEKYLGN